MNSALTVQKINQSSPYFRRGWPHFFLNTERTGFSTERTAVWFLGNIIKPGFFILCF